MEFRWAALIALWTLLSGPVFDSHRPAPNPISTHKRPFNRRTSSSNLNHFLVCDGGRASQCGSRNEFSAAC